MKQTIVSVVSGIVGGVLAVAALAICGRGADSPVEMAARGAKIIQTGNVRYVVYRDQLVPVSVSTNASLGEIMDALGTAVYFSTNGVAQ